MMTPEEIEDCEATSRNRIEYRADAMICQSIRKWIASRQGHWLCGEEFDKMVEFLERQTEEFAQRWISQGWPVVHAMAHGNPVRPSGILEQPPESQCSGDLAYQIRMLALEITHYEQTGKGLKFLIKALKRTLELAKIDEAK